MVEEKPRRSWEDFPFEDEEAAIRHINDHSVSPEAREKTMRVYLHMKRNYDEMLLEEMAEKLSPSNQEANMGAELQAI